MSETIADIVAEMRSIANEQERLCFYDLRNVATDTLRVIADRIESVTKCNQPEPVTNCNGLNAAKVREVLEEMTEFLDTWKDHLCGTIGEEAQEHINKAEATLSAPLRNLDRFETSNDAIKAFEKETGKTNAVEFSRWLLAEAK